MRVFRFLGLAVFLIILCQSCHVGRFFYYNFANISDHKIFPNRSLHNDSVKFKFPTTDKGQYWKNVALGEDKKSIPFDDFLEKNKTVAFLIIKNDTIQYEKYFNGYEQSDVVASFSMAKSITSILIGCAIEDGYIKNVDEPITNYIPELKANGFEKISIKHLLQMTSGVKFNESYFNPNGEAALFYYGKNLRKRISKMEVEKAPGTEFSYKSGDPQLLGLVLERALKTRTITQYLNDKIWSQIGMEYDASWSIDQKKNGLEKTFCCINARALDFAKIGRLYLNKGNWEGKQIVPEQWVNESVKGESTNGAVRFYKYQWWLPSQSGDFMAQGILGQYIYVNPAKKLIIVRLGKNYGDVNWSELFMSMAESY